MLRRGRIATHAHGFATLVVSELSMELEEDLGVSGSV